MAKINIINAKRKYEGAIHAAIYCRVSTAQAFQIHDNSPLVLELLQSRFKVNFKITSNELQFTMNFLLCPKKQG